MIIFWIIAILLIYITLGFTITVLPLLKLEAEDRISPITNLTYALIWSMWPLYWVAPMYLAMLETFIRSILKNDKKSGS